MHNALKKNFELRPPLPSTTFELLRVRLNLIHQSLEQVLSYAGLLIKKQMEETVKSGKLIRYNNHSWGINRLPLPFSRSA